jgi:hypothetical protein
VSSLDTETLAEGFAAEGRDELIGRFREAYAKALGTHADLVSFDSERVEAMVQHSAAEADGLQWRRALAGVAARELGIDLGSALTHPAVVRAHQLTGAPSYESALAALAVPAPIPDPPSAPKAAVLVSVAEQSDPLVGSAAVTVADTPEADGADELEPVAHEEAEPDAVEAEALSEPAPVAATAPPVVEPEPELGAIAEVEPGAEPESEVAEAEPEVTAAAPAVPGAEPEVLVAPPVAEPEVDLTELEPAEPGPEPEPEPTVAAPAETARPQALMTGVDDPTMAYDTLGPEVGVEGGETSESKSSDEVLAHRAADFADEFMAGDPVTAVTRTTIEDDLTFASEAADVPAPEVDVTEFGAVHLGGVAALPSSEEIALRLSEEGLDLLQDDGTIVGRLGWTDIAALEVTVPHGRRRRRNAPRLVVHTVGGSARFEVPSLSGEELQDRVQPLMARFGH